MNSFISWIGGKKLLRDIIVQHFPFIYDRYIEVFGGGGWVLFHKHPRNDFEVYNDYNGLLVNLFRCVQNRSKARRMKKLLKYSLNSREEFDRIRKVMNNPNARMADYRRAAYYYQLIRYSYASGLDSFGAQPHDIRSDFPIIDMATYRLRNVVVEHGSFERVIRHYDRPSSFFYCDPPYHTTEGLYKNIGSFGVEQHILLRDSLLQTKGKFLLSYNDDDFVRKLSDRKGIYVLELKRLHNMRQRFEGGAEFPELLIANYDINDPSQLLMGQTTLFNTKFNTNGGLILP